MQKQNIFQKVFGLVIKEVRQPFIHSTTSRYGGGMGMGSNGNYLTAYKNWVFACVNARSTAVGDIKYRLKRNGEIVENHEFLELLKKVNGGMTKRSLFKATQSFLDLDGNAYWFLARDGDGTGKVKEIYILRPDRMRIVLDKTNPLKVSFYAYKQDGTEIPFESNEILHFKNFNPNADYPFPHKGMGVVQAASWAIDSDDEARKWNYAFFKNSARPDGILYTEGEGILDADEGERIKRQWDETYKGSDNAHKIATLSGGLKFQELTRTQKDMDFTGQRTFSRDEILSMFQVPKSIIGITDNVIRANAEAAIYTFAVNTVKPLQDQIIDAINEFLLPEIDDSLELELISPVPEDKIQLVAEWTAGMNKWWTRNEIRSFQGLPETKEGDKFMGSFSDVVVDETKPEPVKSAKPQSKDVVKKKGITKTESIVDNFLARLPESRKTAEQLSDTQKKTYTDIWVKGIKEKEKALKTKLAAYFRKQENEVMANIKEELKGLEHKEYKLKGVDDMLFDEDEAVSGGISLITPFIKDFLKSSGDEAGKLVGIDFDETSKRAEAFIKARAKYFADTINETTRDDLFSTIREGLDNGEKIEEITDRVADIYDKAVDFRIEMIARTETVASSNTGATEAYKQAGIEKHQWVAIEDEVTSDECKECDGQIVDIGNDFVSGESLPPNHPNCRCHTLPIF